MLRLYIQEASMKTISISDLNERINEMLRLIKEDGETIALTDHGKVVAHVIPTPTSSTQNQQNMEAFWAKTDQLAREIGSYLHEKVDVVDIMNDIRSE